MSGRQVCKWIVKAGVFLLAWLFFQSSAWADNICSNTDSRSLTGTLYDSGGRDGGYSNNENCGFRLEPSAGAITLTFSALDVRLDDALRVYDGSSASADLLGTFTGNSLPDPVVAESGAAFFEFTSNNGGNDAGFALSWSAAIQPVAPVAEWRLDESDWSGAANEVVDSVGSFHGSAFSTLPVPGKVCNAADLGASSARDYLLLGNEALDGATDFTLSIWGKTGAAGNQTLFSGANGAEDNELLMFFPDTTTFTPYLKGDGSGSIRITDIADNQWHHFVWTRSGSQNCLYIDNSLQGCASKTTTALSIAAGGLILGQEQDALGGGFDSRQDWDGLLDEPLVFRTALSVSQIDEVYTNQLAGLGWDGTARACVALLGSWRMDESGWNGSVNEVVDASGHSYHARAVNGAVTAAVTPAIRGNPGSCRYGAFDDAGRSRGDYLEIAGFPNLTTDFSITGWIRSQDVRRQGQRVFSDDEAARGGYGLSLGDGGNGRLRFYSRGTSPVSLDSNAVIAANTWYFVAGVADVTNQVRTLYIYQADGTLLDSVSARWTGSWSTDAGPASIGGETNSGETASRFFGNLDEVRVYTGVLDTRRLESILNETHYCPGVPTSHWRFDERRWVGEANEIADSVGLNHGVAYSASTTSGLLCNAADLSANSTRDYLSLNNRALNGATDFTLSVWAKTTNSGIQTLFSGANGSEDNELLMYFSNATTFNPFLMGDSSGTINTANIADNQWHHLVWTRNGAQNCLYMDTNLQGCISRPLAAVAIAADGLILGQDQDSLGGGFDVNQDWSGQVDEVLIFPEALSAATIASIYNNTRAGKNWDGEDRDCAIVCSDTFGDNFNAASFGNNDGSKNWSGDWVESDAGGRGVSSGNVQVRGGQLAIQGNTGSIITLTRQANLAMYEAATLRFDYRVSSQVDNTDQVLVRISADGGRSWATLEAISGISNTSGTKRYDISGYVAMRTQIQFWVDDRSGVAPDGCCYGDAASEWFLVDNLEIEADDNDCAAGVDHYAISHDGSGISCQSESITLTAHDHRHAAIDPGRTAVNLSTSSNKGLWALVSSGSGRLRNNNLSNGAATYVFPGNGETSVTLALNYADLATDPESLNINVSDGSATDPGDAGSEDPALSVASAGFLFSNIPTQIAGKDSTVGFNRQTITLQAVRASDGDPAVCTRVFSGDQSIELAAECRSPGVCSSGPSLPLRVGGTAIATNDDNAAPLTTNYTAVPLTFDAQAAASLALNYPDAGLVQLHARSKIPDDVGGVSSSYMVGSSNDFVVRPFGFGFSAIADGAISNPGGQLPGSSGFTVAGKNFTGDIGAYRYAAGEDADADGVPDVGASVTDNGLAPNYRGALGLSISGYTPASGLAGSFSPASVVIDTGGVKRGVTFNYGEVGSVQLAAVANYFGLVDGDIVGVSAPIGRFYPSHFRLGAASLVNRADISSCSDPFTYIGEPFNVGLTLTAENVAKGTTHNYQGGYAKLDSYAELGFGALSGGVDLTSRLVSAALPTISWVNGSAVVSADLLLQPLVSPEAHYAAFQLGVAPRDDDAVQLSIFDLDVDGNASNEHGWVATTDLRYGRAVVDNAFGPETAALPVRVGTEYFDGTGFVENEIDNCTAYGPANLSLDFRDGGLYAGDELDGAPSPETAIASVASAVVAGSSAAVPVTLTAPGEGNAGQVDLVFDVDSWLEFDWQGSGRRDPYGQATFGRYRGHDRVIYWREQLSN